MRAADRREMKGLSTLIRTDLLVDYMLRFVGFGAPSASVWFVGLEQGGGENLAELDRRLAVWADLGCRPFADLREYCLRLGDLRWHGNVPRIQPTLGKLVRLILALEGKVPTPDVVREYQAHQFGRLDGQTVIAELMPLPCRNVSDWIYSAVNGVPELITREAYVDAYRRPRIALLRAAIRASAPRVVVFIGLSETETWAEIADQPFADGPANALWARSGQTRWVILKHPTAFGAKNAYFETIGREISA